MRTFSWFKPFKWFIFIVNIYTYESIMRLLLFMMDVWLFGRTDGLLFGCWGKDAGFWLKFG